MAVVAVGREGVVWWEGEGKKGWILSSSVCLSPRMESLPKGGGEGFQLPFWPSPAFSLACSYVRLTMRDARRRLTCVHPFSLSPPPPIRASRSETRRYAHDVYRVHDDAPGGTTVVEVHQHFPFSSVVWCSVKGLKAWKGRCRHEGKARAQRVQ